MTLSVLGAGAFGTSLAVALSRDGTPVTLVARDAMRAEALEAERANASHLPGVHFPETLRVSAELETGTTSTVLLAVPMQALSDVVRAEADKLAHHHIVACCKGIDLQSGRGPSAVLEEVLPKATVAVLTGPSFAADLGADLPTALTLACRDAEAGAELQSELARPNLRIYQSTDVIGAELGGALKNVMALAAGLTIGSGLGESARASVITRGFAEMQRIAGALGADPATLSGLSGLGDLVLTCTSEKSRNFSAGVTLGAGKGLPPNRTIEGIATAKAVAVLAAKHGIEAPLTATVAAVLNKDLTLSEARESLLSRPLRPE